MFREIQETLNKQLQLLAERYYESKKKTGNFSRSQLVILCDLFDCNFEYLFKVKNVEHLQSADRPA